MSGDFETLEINQPKITYLESEDNTEWLDKLINNIEDCAYAHWVLPFGNLRIKGCLPPPRSLSQVTTSFIAFSCQGIRLVLLIT